MTFFHDRFKNHMRDNGIRHDIIECALFSYNLDNILKIYTKANVLNKLISKEVGADVIFSYKRAFNILIKFFSKT